MGRLRFGMDRPRVAADGRGDDRAERDRHATTCWTATSTSVAHMTEKYEREMAETRG